MRRGMTLIEVIASVVLLTIIAVTCLPMLQQAARNQNHPQKGVTLGELNKVLQAVTEKNAVLDNTSSVNVHHLRSSVLETDHEWVVISTDDVFVLKWRFLEDEGDDQ